MKFTTYNYDESAYMNYKRQYVTEMIYSSKKANALKEALPEVSKGEVNSIFAITKEDVSHGQSPEELAAKVPKSSLQTLPFAEYYTHLSENNVSLPKPDPEGEPEEVSAELYELIRTQGVDLGTETISPYDHEKNGVDGEVYVSGFNIMPFIFGQYRQVNPINGPAKAVKETVDNSINNHKATVEETLALFDRAADYFESISNEGVASITGKASQSVGGNSINDISFEVLTDLESSSIESVIRGGGYNGFVIDPSRVPTRMVSILLNEVEPTIMYQGTSAEYERSKGFSNGTPYNLIQAIKSRRISGIGLPTQIPEEYRLNFSEIKAAEVENIRFQAFANLVDEEAYPDDGAYFSDSEVIAEVARLLLRDQFSVDNDDFGEWKASTDDNSDEKVFHPTKITAVMTTTTLKEMFKQTHQELKYMKEVKEDQIAEALDTSIGTILDTFGGGESYLKAEFGPRLETVNFHFALPLYENMLAGNGTDQSMADYSDTVALYTLLGERLFSKVTYPVFKGVQGEVAEEYGTSSAVKGEAGSQITIWYGTRAYKHVGYVLNWKGIKELSSSELLQLVNVFFGRIQVRYGKKKTSVLSNILKVFVFVVVSYATGFKLSGPMAALFWAGVVVTAIGMVTNNSKLMMMGSVMMTIATLGSTSAFTSPGKAIQGFLANITVTDVVMYTMKLANMVLEHRYDSKLSELRAGITANTEVVNEMEELLTELDRNKTVQKFIYEESIDAGYTHSYTEGYKYDYRYL